MCIIALKRPGVTLPDDQIRYMYARNRDGAGYMFAKDGKVHYKKGFFDVSALIASFRADVDDDTAAAIHCRIRTHGDVNAALCHPFPLDPERMFESEGDTQLCLMHNGIIPDRAYIRYRERGDSDTTAYCRKLASSLHGQLPGKQEERKIAGEIDGSRLLIMNGQGEYSLIGKWHESAGILYSNPGFLPEGHVFPSSPFRGSDRYDEWLWSHCYPGTKRKPVVQDNAVYHPIDEKYLCSRYPSAIVHDVDYFMGPDGNVYYREKGPGEPIRCAYTIGFDYDSYAESHGLYCIPGDSVFSECTEDMYYADIDLNEVYTMDSGLHFTPCDEETAAAVLSVAYDQLFGDDEWNDDNGSDSLYESGLF